MPGHHTRDLIEGAAMAARAASHHPIFQPIILGALGTALAAGTAYGILATDIRANTQSVAAARASVEHFSAETSQRFTQVAEILTGIQVEQATSIAERRRNAADIERLRR